MRKLKKAASILTAAVLTVAMGMTAYAASSITVPGNSSSKAVMGTYQAGGSAETVYRVDITWGSMAFTYTEAGAGEWNPETHKYDGAGSGSWSSAEGAGDITVANHSNAAVKAVLEFEAGSGFSGVTGKFTANELSLADASEENYIGDPEKAPTANSTLSLEGTPSSFEGNKALGTVKVTISAVN